MKNGMRMFLWGVALAVAAAAADRPNILWITSEDNSHHYLGAYGNTNARTPHLDRLAAGGIRFSHAYSHAPVCAVARSTILTGVHAPAQGTHHMRSRYPIPAAIQPYVTYLREAGYFCTNAGKMDYNIRMDDLGIWDQSVWQSYHEGAHYRNRAPGQPFFAVFNLRPTHESRLFPANIAEHRADGRIPATPRVDPADVELPAFLPDEAIFREDIAIYHDYVTLMDSQAGAFLAELAEEGLADDTIVFYYSDHGGVTPRTKRWIFDTGTRVPLIIYVPEKWRHLSPFAPGSVVDAPVSFVDLAPTLLQLAGVEIPSHMAGQSLLGPGADKRENDHVLLFGDRFDERSKMRRGITDGEYRYIINFMPRMPGTLDIEFPYGMRSWARWREMAQAGELDAALPNYFHGDFPDQLLFHTDADPWEIDNLVNDPAQQPRVDQLRTRLVREMQHIHDLGFIPESMFHELPEATVMEAARNLALAYPEVIAYAVEVALGEVAPARLLAGLTDPNPLMRYWSGVGLRRAPWPEAGMAEALSKLRDDKSVANRIVAARLLHQAGDESAARDLLLRELTRYEQDEVLRAVLEAIDELGFAAEVDREWLEAVDAHYDRKFYHHRLARLILAQQTHSG